MVYVLSLYDYYSIQNKFVVWYFLFLFFWYVLYIGSEMQCKDLKTKKLISDEVIIAIGIGLLAIGYPNKEK